MKKVLAAIVLFVYFTFSTGFVVSLHFCMDQLDSAQLGTDSSDECGRCGMHKDKANDCCWDEVKVIKIQHSHLSAKAVAADFSLPLTVSEPIAFITNPFYNFTQARYQVAHSPPLNEQGIFIRNCVFRI